MKLFVVCFILAVCLCNPECPSGVGGGSFSLPSYISVPILQITTYNAYWLFNNPSNMVPWKTPEECLRHADQISRVLSTFSESLIINICEVQNCEILDYVRKKSLGHEYRTFIKQGRDTHTRQNVGILSKIQPLQPLGRSDTTSNYPLKGSLCRFRPRKVLKTGVSKNYFSLFQLKGGRKLLVVGLHLKAKPNEPGSCSKREAQASVIIQEVKQFQKVYKDLLVIILGDFNDYDGNLLDKSNDVPKSQVIAFLKRELSLRNVFEKVGKEKRYSYFGGKNKYYQLIDHILVSTELFEVLVSVNVEEYPPGKFKYSDHFPVTARFDMSAFYEPDILDWEISIRLVVLLIIGVIIIQSDVFKTLLGYIRVCVVHFSVCLLVVGCLLVLRFFVALANQQTLNWIGYILFFYYLYKEIYRQ